MASKVLYWTKDVKVGDLVSYHDVNLWFRRGRLTRIAPGPHHQDCWVKWDNQPLAEYPDLLSNLVAWK